MAPLAGRIIDLVAELFDLGAVEVQAAHNVRLLEEGEQGIELLARGARQGLAVEEVVAQGGEGAAQLGEAAAQGGRVVGRGLRFVRVASEVLSVAAALATVGILIYEAVEGERQRTELRE